MPHDRAVIQGEMMLDQIVSMRLVPAASRYAASVSGFHPCSVGTHPAPGIIGASTCMAAKMLLAD